MKRTGNGSTRVSKRPRKTGPASFKSALKRATARQEVNYVDTAFVTSDVLFDNTGKIDLVNPIPEGTGPNERVGKKIVLKSLQCRGLFTNGLGVNKNAFIIVYDKKPRESIPAITDILETPTSLSMNEDDNSSRFTILKRLDFASAPDGGNGACSALSIDFFLDLKGMPMEYTNTVSGGILGIETGAIYFITIGNEATTPNSGSGKFYFRTRFVDV